MSQPPTPVGLMPVSGTAVALGVTALPSPADQCPGCGRAVADPHPYGCPVLVRLCGQYLHRFAPEGWRAWAVHLGALAGDPWCPEARHWRAVAAEPDPAPEGVFCAGPVPFPAGDGMIERTDPDAASTPGAAALLTPQLVDALTAAFGPQGAGWELCPQPIPDPPVPLS